MKDDFDYKLMLVIPLCILLTILLCIIFYDNYDVKVTNEKLKKEVYKYKKELNQCNNERLEEIIRGE